MRFTRSEVYYVKILTNSKILNAHNYESCKVKIMRYYVRSLTYNVKILINKSYDKQIHNYEIYKVTFVRL